MAKIVSLSKLVFLLNRLGSRGKTIGLITGCFDIIHLGHIDLFRFAKEHVDILVVGVETDRTIKLSKGNERPIFSQNQRMQVLAEQESINFVFPIRGGNDFASNKVNLLYEEICKKLKPDALITCVPADKSWKKKKERANKLNLRFIPLRQEIPLVSTTQIIRIIKRRFGL
ncbi:MAG: hypothetical protein A2117_00125 [Candidatus Wildermuthbacteria bacterium GWA2_46_15]|uniref:Cytidyltransferase-like domain-containing protein n=1 Tax=Candidatus Wildermuthbacteria bacterium GWA2_46_15 TaxID=1802443 RepID=A0A1G2QMW7_9BACT|nr:MAG: hypothetical protein A2117_00125 [Candidatus Wildermuthbacteria bacterium GWA2_46_15]